MRRGPMGAVRLLPLVCALAACGSSDPGPADMTAGDDLSTSVDPVVAARPYAMTLPAGYDRNKLWPLVVLLHGYTATGVIEDSYLGVSVRADAHGFLVAVPDGTVDTAGQHFWNATDACCNIYGSDVDDVVYLTAVIKDSIARYGADPKRVFLLGHSNGGFMAHRLACEKSELVAGIASLAGMTWKDPTRCTPTNKVSVVQIHGDADQVILYNGGKTFAPSLGPYPSAPETFMFWAGAAGCNGTMDAAPIDLDGVLAGDETLVTRATGCAAGGAAELWHIQGGSHIPQVGSRLADAVYDFFATHPRP
jgi:polyhydroxybutyrate depolymerase